MSRPRARREPRPPRPDPGLGRLVPDRPGDAVGRPAGRSRRAARRPEPGPAAGRDPRRGPAARRRRRRDRQDPGDHPPDRLADRHPSGPAVGDPRADVHGQGRGGDAGPGGPARPVRLHGHGDLDVPRVRRPARSASTRSSSACRRTSGSCRRAEVGDLPARAPVRVRARALPAARRPDPLPGRAGDPVQPLQGRGRLAGEYLALRRRRVAEAALAARRRATAPRPTTRPLRATEAARQQPSWPARTPATRSCSTRTAASTSATRWRWPCGSSGRRPPPGRRSRPASGTSWSTSSRTRTGPSPSSSRSLAERHRNVTVVGDDDQSIYAFRGAAISNILGFRDRYRRARTVVLRRNYRSLAPILDAAYRLDPLQRPGPARGPGRDRQAAASRSAASTRRGAGPARGLRDRRGGGGLDRRRDRPADRGRRRAARPRRSSSGRTATRTRSCAASTLAGIPWRFSGTSGLYARPEVRLLLAFLRAIADLGSSVDLYAWPRSASRTASAART